MKTARQLPSPSPSPLAANENSSPAPEPRKIVRIAEAQPSIDQVMGARAAQWETAEAQQRASRAAAWREARRRLARFDDATRAVVLAYWNGHRWLPGDPSYLLDTIHSFERGRLVLEAGTLRPAQTVLARRQRRNPPAAG